MKTRIALSVAALLLVSGTRRPDTPDAEYVDYGKKFSHVLKFHCENRVYATCVVISNDYVVTSAHCLDDDKWWEVEGPKGEMHKVVSASLHASEDIAVCLVSPPFEFHSFPELVDDDKELSRVCEVAGYGCTGTFLTGYRQNQDGKRRGGQAVIDEIWNDNLLACPVDGKVRLAYCISPGDSGGGLFIDGKLAGINSKVTGCNGKSSAYGCYSLHVRVSKVREWILEETSSLK